MPLWDTIEASGHDPEPLFRELHIGPALRYDPHARISLSKVEQIWRWISRKVDDPCIGLRLAEHWHPSAAGALGYAWLTSSSLRTAIGRPQRFLRIVKDFHLTSVSFSHSEPRCAGDFFAFFRYPVNFGARDNRITLPVEMLDQRLSDTNPQLAQLNDQAMINYLARLSDDNLIEKVKAILIDLLPSGEETDPEVANAMYTSTRSLQRRLQQDGTTFKTILNEVQEELAYKYLQGDRISLGEISFLMGFSEMSSFSRAFKRWKGVSPRAYKGE